MSAPEAERFPLKDRYGYPLGVSCFVEVERPGLTPGRVNSFMGQVTALTEDAKGPILRIREWSAGKWTGREKQARPSDAKVRQAPTAARELLTDEARFSRVVADRGGEKSVKPRLAKRGR